LEASKIVTCHKEGPVHLGSTYLGKCPCIPQWNLYKDNKALTTAPHELGR